MAASRAAVPYAPSDLRLIPRPGLFELLSAAERVVQVSAPAGSGKTFLLRSWVAMEGLGDRAAWVSLGREEHDPQAFWLSVLDSLRQTRAGSERVRELTAAPGLDGAALVRRLLEDLSTLDEPLWLVIDDLHELKSQEAVVQLGRLLALAPPQLQFVLLTRRDLRLGLHRLRVEGELTEIRGEDLRFSLEESRALLDAAGVRLSDGALESVLATTEGWAAGLRLVALSLARHPDPERYAAGFSGRERTVAEYLLAEVLDRQPPEVTRLLVRTSLLERVSGPLADRLTGASGSERILMELEDAGAFVVAADPERTWFRYHHLFADLLALELRRTAPDELPGLHTVAAGWFSEHGYPVEAIRHAQAAERWGLAARMLADHWPAFHLDGQAAIVHELLAAFPAETRMADAELAVLSAVDELTQGSLEAAERYLALAERAMAGVPDGRHPKAQLLLGIVRLLHARQRGNLPAVAEQARRLQVIAETPDATRPDPGDDLRALALINLGSAEFWAGKSDEYERHLERGVALARQIGRPYLEFTGLAYQVGFEFVRSFARTLEKGRQAVELAERHGWTDEPAVASIARTLGAVLVFQGRPEEAEAWIQRAERALRAEVELVEELAIRNIRGHLELARGQDAEALAAFEAADRLARRLAEPSLSVLPNRSWLVQTLVRLGETARAEETLAELDDQDRDSGAIRIGLATLRLAQPDPEAAIAALTPVLDGSAPLPWPAWLAQAFLLDAIARDALGDEGSAGRALEHALDAAEPDGILLWFLLNPVPDLLERHARSRTTHASLLSEILNLLSGRTPPARPNEGERLREPLSESELRVLRYLPTNLRAPEIAAELFVSLNTIRTHLRNVYAKLGVHTRADAVTRARELGLLSPTPLRR